MEHARHVGDRRHQGVLDDHRKRRQLTGRTLPATASPARVRIRNLAAKAVLSPTVLVVLVCFYGCAIWTTYLSVTRSALLPNYQLAGLFQYVRLFATPRWNVAWSNMFLFGVLDILGTLGLGVLLAVLLDRQVRLEGAFRTIFLYPLSISFIVTGLTWQWVLSPTIGVQDFVRGLGWSDFVFDWITRPDRAIYTLVFAGVWPNRADHGDHARRSAWDRPRDLAGDEGRGDPALAGVSEHRAADAAPVAGHLCRADRDRRGEEL